jgi:16S rRNA (guanine1207-N2)-methyltransferase
VRAGHRTVPVATRPGVFADGTLDDSAALLARHVTCRPTDTVVHLGCGNGFAAAAAPPAAQVLLADRHVANVAAARRTLAANGLAHVVHHAHGIAAPHADAADDGTLRLADASVDAVTIRIPHEKGALLPLLVDAHRVLRVGGRCWVAGGTSEGIKPAVALVETLFGGVATAGQGGGHRLVVATRRDRPLPDEPALRSPFLDHDHHHVVQVVLRGHAIAVHTRPGVFSWEHLDEATALLAEHMTVPRGTRVLDLGCGAGVLGVVASRLADRTATFVDADAEALRAARRTVAAAGLADARVLASDIAEAVLEERFDTVVANPPFHMGKATALAVPTQFILDAWDVLAPGGTLQLVANRTLPYEAILAERFGAYRTVHDGPRFKVLAATKR